MERLVLFAKAPRLFDVKTRLTPALTAEQAMRLHEAMLADQIAFVRAQQSDDRECELCLDQPLSPRNPEAHAMDGLSLTLQGEGDLGARMDRALTRAFSDGVTRAAIVGADAPTLPRRLLEDALAHLDDGADAAVVPALDGGYVVIAASHSVPALLADIPWGTPSVLAVTRRRATEGGLVLAETAPWSDVDVASDLPRLASELADDPSRATATASFLAALGLYAPSKPVV